MEDRLKDVINSITNESKKELITEHFNIQNNLLKFKTDTVQISNISQIFAGKNKINISLIQIVTGIICLYLFFAVEFTFIKTIGFIGFIYIGLSVYKSYKKYIDTKYILRFYMNSGTTYLVSFKDFEFLQKVREIVELSILEKNLSYNIDTGDKVILNGDGDIIQGNNNNLNSGFQKDIDFHSNNTVDKSDHSTMINDSTINNSNVGENNTIDISKESFDWDMLEIEFKSVLTQLKIETPLKEVSKEALQIIETKDESKFKKFLIKYSEILSSDFFQNTASGLLVFYISSFINHS